MSGGSSTSGSTASDSKGASATAGSSPGLSSTAPEAANSTALATRPLEVGGKVSAPVPIYAPDPPYSEKARVVKYSGSLVLALVVDGNGGVIDARDTRPLGLGLDENAIATVRTWKFRPATRDGVPVNVRLNVEVTFRIR